jgi:hypothetical protein
MLLLLLDLRLFVLSFDMLLLLLNAIRPHPKVEELQKMMMLLKKLKIIRIFLMIAMLWVMKFPRMMHILNPCVRGGLTKI